MEIRSLAAPQRRRDRHSAIARGGRAAGGADSAHRRRHAQQQCSAPGIRRLVEGRGQRCRCLDRGQGPETSQRHRRARADHRRSDRREPRQRGAVQGRQGQGLQRARRSGDEGEQGQGQSAAGECAAARQARRMNDRSGAA